MEFVERDQNIYKNTEALSPGYIPNEIQCRANELRTLFNYFSSFVVGVQIPNIMILGAPGTGKTVCVRYVINKLVNQKNIHAVYLTAFDSPYSFLRRIVNVCDLNVTRRHMTPKDLFELIVAELDRTQKNIVIIVDEFDKMIGPAGNGFDLLYHFSRTHELGYTLNLSMVLISNKMNIMQSIADNRTLSSLQLKKITFLPYEVKELQEIVSHRAKEALFETAYVDEVITLCAALTMKKDNDEELNDNKIGLKRSFGDARLALDLLRAAALECYVRGEDMITEEHVRYVFRNVKMEMLKDTIKLGDLNRCALLHVIAINSGANASDIYKEYAQFTRKVLKQVPLKLRRLQEYINEFEEQGVLFRDRQGQGYKGGVRWPIFIHEDIDETILDELASQGFQEQGIAL